MKFHYVGQQAKLRDSVGVEDCLSVPSLNLIVNFTSCMFRVDLLRSLPERAFKPRLSEIVVAFIALKFGRIGYLDTPLNVWRNHEGSLWFGKTKLEQLKEACEIRKTLRDVTGLKRLDAIIESYEQQINKLSRSL